MSNPILSKHDFTTNGRVYSKWLKCFLPDHLNADGYPVLKVKHDDGKYKNTLIHRIVSNLYIPNPHNLETVNHINGNKTDYRVENLEWMSKGDNCRHYTESTDRWWIQAKLKLHVNAVLLDLTRKNNRTYITYTCRICEAENTTRLDSPSIVRGLCKHCAKQKQQGSSNAKY